jgi:hypothetical protein
MFEDTTQNQHFVSQVELRLNALNPQAADKRMRIYSFRLVDRETHSLVLECQTGKPIVSTLSLSDLFSFDVVGGGQVRLNFESLFQKYEKNIELHTKSLLAKLNQRGADIKAEIIDLFAAKLLNFVRNPYSIEKVLNTFPNLASYQPTDPVLLDIYRRIVSGRKPQQAHHCRDLGISDQQYAEWLGVLFMLLVPTGAGRPNFFESIIKGLMEDRKLQVAAYVYQYDTDGCLLSDRGFSQPIPDGEHTGFSFNLCSRAFIHYIFADAEKLVEGRAPPDFLADAMAFFHSRPQVMLNVTPIQNDRAMLALYNRRVIEQCYERVYCSVKDGLVL